MEKKLLIIDGSSCFYRAFHAIPRFTNSKGLPTNAVYGFIQTLRKILKHWSPDYVCVAFDVKGPGFRHALYDKYKVERPPMPDELALQVPYVKKAVAAMNIAAMEKEGFEADDVIGTVTSKLAGVNGLKVVIVTGDKDMMQLVGDAVSVFDFVKDKEYGKSEVREKLGVDPDKVADLLALSGDPTDSIPGVRGIGPKTAVKLLGEFGSLDALLEGVEAVKSEKVREALKEHAGDARVSKELASIRTDVPLEFDLDALRLTDPNYGLLEALLNELEFSKLLKDMVPGASGVKSCVLISEADELRQALVSLNVNKPLCISPDVSSEDGVISGSVLNGMAVAAEGCDKTYYIALGNHGNAPLLLDILSGALMGVSREKSTDNAKALYSFCRSNDIDIKNVSMDASIGAYLLNTDRASFDDVSYDLIKQRPVTPGKDATKEELAGCAASRASILVELTPKILEGLKEAGLISLFRDIELPLTKLLSEMECVGVKVSVEELSVLSNEMGQELGRLEKSIYEKAGCEFNINSPKQLSELLFGKLGLKPVKKTKTGFSTDESVLTVLAERHPVPAEIINYRQLSKLKSTFVDGLLEAREEATGRVHTTFNQTVTATGRLSSSNPNLQNIPVKGPYAERIRGAFIAEDGCMLVSADYSQIELRIVAHLSGDELLIDSFQKGEDIHSRTASEVFGLVPGLVTKEMRRRAKAINFGIIYGMGPHGLSAELKVPIAEAKAYIDAYFARYKGVKAFMDNTIAVARERGFTETLFGRKRLVPELSAGSEQAVRFGERIAINTPVQGSAADIIKAAMLRVDKGLKAACPSARLILQIHDELVVEVKDGDSAVAADILKKEMEGVYTLKVPLSVNVSMGRNWHKAG